MRKPAAPRNKPAAAAPPASGQRIGYVRVSTVEQSTARQLDGIPLDRVFEDKASGGNADRPQLQAALAHLRAGDTLIVHSMDRLARSLDDLRRIVRELTGRGVRVEFVKEGQTFTGERSPIAELLLALLGAVAEFERSLIRERQAEGIAKAKQRGVYKGRRPKLSAEQVATLLAADAAAGGKDRAALAREFSISRETLYSYLRDAAPQRPAAKATAARRRPAEVPKKAAAGSGRPAPRGASKRPTAARKQSTAARKGGKAKR